MSSGVTFSNVGAFVSSHSLSSLSLTESEQLQAYALYKQATRGPLKAQSNFTHLKHSLQSLNLIRRARYNAWLALGDMTIPSAKERYVSLIWSRNKAHFGKLDQLTEATLKKNVSSSSDLSKMGVGSARSGGSSLTRESTSSNRKEGTDYFKMDKTLLITELQQLQAEVDALRVFRVYKQGELSRCRQTMTGEEWTDRYYEVKPGYLRCYKSDKMMFLRAEIPLFIGVTCTVIDNTHLRQNGLFLLKVKIPYANKSGIGELTLGTNNLDEADDWCTCILKAAQDGGKKGDETTKRESRRHTFDTSLKEHVHKKYQASFLSSDNPDRQSYRGFFNLVMIVCFVSNMRAIVDSVVVHGNIVAKFILEVTTNPQSLTKTDYQIMIAFWSLWLFVVAAFGIEFVAGKTLISSELVTRSLHFLNCAASLLIPCAVIHITNCNFIFGAPYLFMAIIVFLKLISYAHTNTVLRERWLNGTGSGSGSGSGSKIPASSQTRQQRAKSNFAEPTPTMMRKNSMAAIPFDANESSTSYPNNLTLRNIIMFQLFPTLCYQTAYPRTPKIRKRWLAKRVLELLLCVVAQFLLFTQLMKPVLSEDEDPFSQLLKIAIPSLVCWILMFYGLFHLWLNILAEVTFFGDRLFYKAWWNATRLDVYWRLWNMPVHQWLVRHAFFPCMHAGFSKNVSMLVVFFLSAFFHELLVSVPLHVFKLYAFLGMMGQIPLIWITNVIHRKIPESQIGNFIFWISFTVVGQPLCLMMYFRVILENNTK